MMLGGGQQPIKHICSRCRSVASSTRSSSHRSPPDPSAATYVRVVQVPFQPFAADCSRPSQWHQPTRWPLHAGRLDHTLAGAQQPHKVALPPESDVEVGVAVQRVEVCKRVVQAAAQSP
jgi:hypothetical protein